MTTCLSALQELQKLAGGDGGPPREPFSTGSPALDALLPTGALPRGALVEWLGGDDACGATTLALLAARQAQRAGGVLVVVDPSGRFYPPAAAAWGIELANLLVVRPASEDEAGWALDQALRSEHVAAAIGWPRRLENRVFRRLQLAAERSGATGLLVRPQQARREPSWGAVRLLVRPLAALTPESGWQFELEVLRCRGSWDGRRRAAALEFDPRTGEVRTVAAARQLIALTG